MIKTPPLSRSPSPTNENVDSAQNKDKNKDNSSESMFFNPSPDIASTKKLPSENKPHIEKSDNHVDKRLARARRAIQKRRPYQTQVNYTQYTPIPHLPSQNKLNNAMPRESNYGSDKTLNTSYEKMLTEEITSNMSSVTKIISNNKKNRYLPITSPTQLQKFFRLRNLPTQSIGTVETPRGISSCVLMADGNILTTLHSIFDIHEYADAYHDPSLQRQSVWQHFDNLSEVIISFNSQAFSIEYLVISGLSILQNDVRLQTPVGGWDFAILRPVENIQEKLNIRGLLLDGEDRTYGSLFAADIQARFSIAPPHMRNNQSISNNSQTHVQAYDSAHEGMELGILSEQSNQQSLSGNVTVEEKDDIYYAFSLINTNNTEIFISEIVNRIKYIHTYNLVVQPDKYHELLKESLRLDQFVMKPKTTTKTLSPVVPTLRNTKIEVVNIDREPLDKIYEHIRNFFNLENNIVNNNNKVNNNHKMKKKELNSKDAQLEFCKIQITPFEQQYSISLVIRRADKYLIGIEVLDKGQLKLFMGKAAGYDKEVDLRYPEEFRRINTHPFSINGIRKQLNDLGQAPSPEKIQRFFEYFIQVVEISKLPVIDKLNKQIVQHEERSGNNMQDLVGCTNQGQNNYEYNSADENLVIPASLGKLPEIMHLIKTNYGKLVGVTERSTVSEFINDLNEKMNGNKKSTVDFIREIIYPVLDVLGLIDENHAELFPEIMNQNIQQTEEQLQAQEKMLLDMLENYYLNIKSLFIPLIK